MNTVRKVDEGQNIPKSLRDLLINSKELNFSVRVLHGAEQLGIKTFNELIEAYEKDDPRFLRIFGKKSQQEIRQKIIIKNATHLRVVREED